MVINGKGIMKKTREEDGFIMKLAAFIVDKRNLFFLLTALYASIDGDINVGGIAGALAIEYEFDPEDDFAAEGAASYRAVYGRVKFDSAIFVKLRGRAGAQGFSRNPGTGGIFFQME